MEKTRRLVTRSDFDGLACAMMLKELDMIDEIKFVHPKDVQDGKIELSKDDITTNPRSTGSRRWRPAASSSSTKRPGARPA